MSYEDLSAEWQRLQFMLRATDDRKEQEHLQDSMADLDKEMTARMREYSE